jgi:hypothetical protein
MRLAAACLLASLQLPLTSCSVGRSVSSPEKNRDLISQASFCDAYVLRNTDKRDHRPSPEEESFPFLKEGTRETAFLARASPSWMWLLSPHG